MFVDNTKLLALTHKMANRLTSAVCCNALTLNITKVKKFFSNSELKVKTYEIFRPYFDRTSSVNDMNVKKMNFKKVFLTPLGG